VHTRLELACQESPVAKTIMRGRKDGKC